MNRPLHQQTTYMTGLGKTVPALIPNTHLLLGFFHILLHFSVVCLPSTRDIMIPRCFPHISEPFCCRLQPWPEERCLAGLEKAFPPELPWGCARVAWQGPSSPGSVLHNLACLQPFPWHSAVFCYTDLGPDPPGVAWGDDLALYSLVVVIVSLLTYLGPS